MLSGDGFKWIEETSKFNEDFIKSHNEECDTGYVFEVDVHYFKKLNDHHIDLPFFCLKEWKLKKMENLQSTCLLKRIPYTHKKFKTNITS